MSDKKLIVIGGFLGAGKTSTILALAKYFMKAEKEIGIVTNDQGSELVDTNFLAANKLSVLAVEGRCFCCDFEGFTQKVIELKKSKNVDILLAEPVGSCTDLVATIFKPLLRNEQPMLAEFSKEFTLSPLVVVVDPKRVKRLMNEKNQELFPTEVNYLFERQLQEANLIVLNKCDAIEKDEVIEVREFLYRRFKGTQVICISAKEGTGIENLAQILACETFVDDSPTMEMDYVKYAEAEAALGWLNMSCHLQIENAADINALTKQFMVSVKERLKKENAEIAHLKCYAVAQNEFYKASITSVFDEIDENATMNLPQKQVNLIINARVGTNPELLKMVCEEELKHTFKDFEINYLHTECFKPSPPNPTHRITD